LCKQISTDEQLVCIVTKLWTGCWGSIPSRGKGQYYFLFGTTSRLVLGPTQLPIQWVLGVLSLGMGRLKQPSCEPDHSPPSSAKVEYILSYQSRSSGLWHHIVWWDTNISEAHSASITSPWSSMQHGPLKR